MSQSTDPDAAARDALRLLGPDPQNWVPPLDGIDHSVTIVGGGQSGTALAFALRRAGVGGVTVIDAAPDEARAGLWLNGARMNVLRTPKNLPGPELGIAALGFQAWYEARHGRDAYAALTTIPRLAWADYLGWYRRFLAIPVRYATRLDRIEPADGHFRLHLDRGGAARVETSRKVILASGFAASGHPYRPPVLDRLPDSVVAHTADAIDFAALRGKSVAVIGAAASAFDAAAVALESGAAEVRLYARRPTLSALPVNRARGYPGAYDNYPLLPDAVRWQHAVRFRRAGSTAPADAVARAVAFPNFRIHLDAAWQAAAFEDGRIVARVGAERAVVHADFVIAGTGYAVDPSARPELADVASDILLWRDRYAPPADERDDELGGHPYLGTGHEFQERIPGTAPHLRDIHAFDLSGFVSFGVPVGDVPSVKRGIPAVAAAVSRDLFLRDLPHHHQRMTTPPAPDFDETLYGSALARTTAAVSA